MTNLNLWKRRFQTTTIMVVMTKKKNKSECNEKLKTIINSMLNSQNKYVYEKTILFICPCGVYIDFV